MFRRSKLRSKLTTSEETVMIAVTPLEKTQAAAASAGEPSPRVRQPFAGDSARLAYGAPPRHPRVTACRVRPARSRWRTLVALAVATSLAVVLLGLLGSLGQRRAGRPAAHAGHAVRVWAQTSAGGASPHTRWRPLGWVRGAGLSSAHGTAMVYPNM